MDDGQATNPGTGLFQPLIVRGHTFPSRLVLPPMASQTADTAGVPTDATRAHYRRIVSRHHGLAFVEYTYVADDGRSEPNQTGLASDGHAAALGNIARDMHTAGVTPGIQLSHGGAKSTGARPAGASAIAVPLREGSTPVPYAMCEGAAARLVQEMTVAAVRAQDAGFKVIEIHAAHGYLLNQWLSPVTNQRTDRHGGDAQPRAQLPLSIVRELRAALDDTTLLSMRYAMFDRVAGGTGPSDSIDVAGRLHEAGIDIFNVSSGLGGWRRQRTQRGEGYLVADAALLRRELGVTVIGVGGINTPAFAHDLVDRGEVDMVAVGRAALADPGWAPTAFAQSRRLTSGRAAVDLVPA